MNPKQFLTIGGWVLLLVAILGAIGILGPTADKSIFGDAWVFTAGENWAHFILGVVALLAAMTLGAESQKMLVGLVGLIALVVGVWGFFLGSDTPNFYGANLENPLDNILHLAIAVWAYMSMKDAKA
ncbi:hypothetical protein HY374_01070 [Candidatus Berkelbacteria bacterium]|nr:hypothetical protein [Candidatus Berkelbacteria bacterium]